MGESHSVLETFFFTSCFVGCTHLEAYRNLCPSGLTVLEIKMIMWKNDSAVQTAVILYCVLSCSIYGDDFSVLYHKSLPCSPKVGSWIKYMSPNLLNYLYYLIVGHPNFLLVVWLKFCIHSCLFHAFSLLHCLKYPILSQLNWAVLLCDIIPDVKTE
jgi:hypothetical protein